jgi:hypothetical protein
LGKKRIEERAVTIDKDPVKTQYQRALAEVKQISGFPEALVLRSHSEGAAVEYEFMVGHELRDLQAELNARRLDAELHR